MQINVRDIDYIKQSTQLLNGFLESIETVANIKINNIKQLLEQSIKELNISNNLLFVAKGKEAQKFTILVQKETELAAAIRETASASGNAALLAAASARLAQKVGEENIARQKHQSAKNNRVNMEKRLELVKKAKTLNERLLERTQNIFRLNITKIENLKTNVNIRLQRAYNELNDYFNYNSLETGELDELESMISSNEKHRINQRSIYGTEVNKHISTTSELEIYQRENLEEGIVNGRAVLKDNNIDWTLIDAKGRTNLERAEKGLAPLDEDGRPYNLHHIGQKADSPLAELRDVVHKQNDGILHDKTISTEVHGSNNNWCEERANHWKNRFKNQKIEDENV